ncbi:unnamed protein product [Rotaria sp. Silwood2]|nr:unnamed protein product [Rotaria sp. Silwood2]
MNELILDSRAVSALTLSPTAFSPSINSALEDCDHARDLFLTIRNEAEEVPVGTSSPVISFCNVGLHVSDALTGSIHTIGHSGNLMNRLSTMLSPEQRWEVRDDLYGMQNGMVTTYTACQAATNELVRSLSQQVHDDPRLCSDAIATQCVERIQEQNNRLQELPATSESIRERTLEILYRMVCNSWGFS